jgi:hypothetical protein
MAQSTKLSLTLSAAITSAPDLATVTATARKTLSETLDSGTGAGQADLVFCDTRSLATGATENLDLAGGSLTSPLGAALTFVEVVGILVVAASANTTDLTVGNGTNPVVGGPFGATGTNTIVLQPGGVFLWQVGSSATSAVQVTAATADILKVTNAAGATASYDIVLIGRSA